MKLLFPHFRTLARGAVAVLVGFAGSIFALLAGAQILGGSAASGFVLHQFAQLVPGIDSQLLAGSVTRADNFLGSGFQENGGYQKEITNPYLDSRSDLGELNNQGIGELTALIFNIKDFLKYLLSAIAVLMFASAGFTMVTSTDDDAISTARRSLLWSVLGILFVFAADRFVVAFFAGGDLANAPGESIILFDRVGRVFRGENISLMQAVAESLAVDLRSAFETLKIYGGAAAIAFIFAMGARIVFSGGESADQAKTYLIHALTGFVAFLMIDAFIFGVIYPLDPRDPAASAACLQYLRETAATASAAFTAQIGNCQTAADLAMQSDNLIMGLLRFAQTLLGSVSVAFLVIAGMRMIASFGSGDEIDSQKKTLIWSCAGLAITMLSDVAIRYFFFRTDFATGTITTDSTVAIQQIVGIANFLVTFVGVLSIVTMLIAGFFWVADFGNEELAGKCKTYIVAAVAGILLSISAHAIIATIASGQVAGPVLQDANFTIQP